MDETIIHETMMDDMMNDMVPLGNSSKTGNILLAAMMINSDNNNGDTGDNDDDDMVKTAMNTRNIDIEEEETDEMKQEEEEEEETVRNDDINCSDIEESSPSVISEDITPQQQDIGKQQDITKQMNEPWIERVSAENAEEHDVPKDNQVSDKQDNLEINESNDDENEKGNDKKSENYYYGKIQESDGQKGQSQCDLI